MALPLWDPLCDVTRAVGRETFRRTMTMAAAVGLGVAAVGLLVSAGLVALSRVTGFPVAAVIGAVILGLLSCAVFLIGRTIRLRRAQETQAARRRAVADLAVAGNLVRSARPLVALAVFAAAFVFARRP